MPSHTIPYHAIPKLDDRTIDVVLIPSPLSPLWTDWLWDENKQHSHVFPQTARFGALICALLTFIICEKSSLHGQTFTTSQEIYMKKDLFEFCDSSHQLFLEKLIKIQSSNRTFQGKSGDVDPVGMRACPPLHILQSKKDTLGKSSSTVYRKVYTTHCTLYCILHCGYHKDINQGHKHWWRPGREGI